MFGLLDRPGIISTPCQDPPNHRENSTGKDVFVCVPSLLLETEIKYIFPISSRN